MGMQMRTVVAVVQVFDAKGMDISEKVAEYMRDQGAEIKEEFDARTCTHVVWQGGDKQLLAAGLEAEHVWVVKPSWVLAIKARRNWILEVKHAVDPKKPSEFAAVPSPSTFKGKKAKTGVKIGGKTGGKSFSSSSQPVVSKPVAAKPVSVNMKRLFGSVTCSVACFNDKGRNVGKRIADLLTAHGAKVSLPPSPLLISPPFY